MLDATQTTYDPDYMLFPNLGRTCAANMRRISVVNDVIRALRQIEDWGLGPTRRRTLEGSIAYYVPSRCKPLESWNAVFEFVDRFVPIETNIDGKSREELEDMFADCLACARAHLQAYRAIQKAAAQ